jgi:hypothetical protein
MKECDAIRSEVRSMARSSLVNAVLALCDVAEALEQRLVKLEPKAKAEKPEPEEKKAA